MKNIINKMLLTMLLGLMVLACKKTETTPTPTPTTPTTPKVTYAYNTADGFGSDRAHNLNIIYFVPKDLDTVPGYKKRLSEILLMGQKFYKEEMTRLGYTDKTFGLWVNDKNRVKIVTIFGTKTKSEYPREGGSGAIAAEINAYFAANPKDQTSVHSLILLPPYGYNADGTPIDGPFYGTGKWCYAMDYEGLEPKYIGTSKFTKWYGGMMHELGHGLNLPHNCVKMTEKASLGTALMGAGNYTLSLSKTSLTATDAAVLNANQIFNIDDKTYYGAVNASISTISANYDAAKASILISGKYATNNKVNSIVYYNDPNVNNEGLGVNKDYNAVTWESKPFGTNEFKIEIPLADLEFKGNTEYELRIGLVHENGTVKSFSYLYKFVNNIPVLEFGTRNELSKQGWSVSSFSSEETSGEGATDGRADKLIDGDLNSYWHSKWTGTAANYPHQVTIDMGSAKSIDGIALAQRNTLSRSVKDFEILVSTDGQNFSSAGNYVLANSSSVQYFNLPTKQTIRYFKIIAKSAHDGDKYAALAEIGVY
ncbi:discoidin domain-containing protein [Pedobacter sp. Hv1]|uniref:discoidin domain-containing protein n=1 Tax=Pedobacter sp. Hv1 TaxID=1740090 RepID=UPI0006D8B90A|nr:discoidin domain-containing protein [Pedobacter sp. Hv1]KQC00158.1 hypothetical protein AQF98_11675 [Pedobacter sp. Hv1]